MEPTTIAVDFDGTIVTHDYPYIGQPVPLAIETIKDWIYKGVKVILWTMRHGEGLEEAVQYCKDAGIKFYGINENPSQHTWTDSQKAYAHYYVDDMAVGCPMMDYLEDRRVVDWAKVREIVGF